MALTTTRPAPFGAETTLAAVRTGEALFTGSRGWFRDLKLRVAVSNVPARALADVGVAPAESMGPRYSQVAARV